MNLQPLLIEFIKNRELLNFVVGIRILETPSFVVLVAPFTNSFFSRFVKSFKGAYEQRLHYF